MRHIYGIGEALLDVIFKNNQPVGATAGGSTLNAIVSLGRMGYNPSFVSEIGNDRIGDLIDNFLLENGVSDTFLFRREGNRSPLALAFLNQNNDAEYEIFKDYSSQSLSGKMPEFKENDIVLFGSFFSINPSLRPQLIKYLKAGKDKGAIIVYDPNYRNHHSHKTDKLITVIEENFSLADIVRGSDEDFKNIYGTEDLIEISDRIRRLCNNVVITANSHGVHLFGNKIDKWYEVLKIDPVSTIGAGDNFNAGLVHGLLKQNISINNIHSITEDQWDEIIPCGIAFASEVCRSLDNYIPNNYIQKLETHISEIKNKQ
ncbi:carbohydrate kinase family protein [Natronoflexus pectinivorans]|uniref:Fructokinase n=1 Tax=Natronoflexus pectinivorans TaxID=682526 RepID=A0A4V2RWJ9_9BACT|nr:carbohydrate kinase [Natronoflexus pectinivorans]TCO08798.1 fructokinase [Natronoflexus pectinivorans]